jgi:hypothetical protein
MLRSTWLADSGAGAAEDAAVWVASAAGAMAGVAGLLRPYQPQPSTAAPTTTAMASSQRPETPFIARPAATAAPHQKSS